MGNVVSVTDSVGNTTTFAYDARNRLTSETNQLNYTRSFTYDDVGNQITATDRNGRVRTFTYDALNRQIAEIWLDGAGNPIRTIASTYDGASQLTSFSDPDSTYDLTYDDNGRLITVDNTDTPGSLPNVVLTYTYDNNGNLLSVSDTINGQLAGTTAYTYDPLNQVIQMTQTGNNVASKRVDFTYDAIGQYDSINRYADTDGTQPVVESNYTFDALNRLENLTHSNTTSTVAFYDFVYDGASRITQISDLDDTTDYTYDLTNQLTGADHTNLSNPDEAYSYDEEGNRTESGYVTGENNRLESDGQYNYEYDPEGNLSRQTEMATGKVLSLEWDWRNRLVAVVDKDQTGNVVQEVTFTYDAMNRRIAKNVDTTPLDAVDGEITYFVYDRENVVLELVDLDGTVGGNSPVLSTRYLHGTRVDEVLAQENAVGDMLWHLTDHLGTVRDLVDSNGTLVNHYTYDSYGNVVQETNPTVDTRYLFTGREFDFETGLYYYRARYYDAQVGRFIGEDPIGFDAGDANLYRYVGNNSTNYIDPSGLITFVIPGGFNNFGNIVNNISQNSRYRVERINNPQFNLPGPIGNEQRLRNALSIIDGQLRFLPLLPGEPINIIAHSDGNQIVGELVRRLREKYGSCTINVGRLDPTFIGKPNSSGASQIVDVGNNVPGARFPTREWFARNPLFLRPDFQAPEGTTHDGLLDSREVIDRLGRNRGSGGYGFNF